MSEQHGDDSETAVDWRLLAGMLSTIGDLKRTPRTGWLDRGVPPARTESVADHAFRVALLAWSVARLPGPDGHGEPIDPGRVLLIALAHDLPEAIAGDPTPYRPEDIPPDEDPAARRAFLDQRQERDGARIVAKREAEASAMTRLLDGLPAVVGVALHEAWREYEDQRTPEARLVKQADRLETYLQSREYLREGPDLPMRSFALQIEDPETLPDARMTALRDAITELVGPAGSLDEG